MADESSDWSDWERFMAAAQRIHNGVRRTMSSDGAPDDSQFWPGETSPRSLRADINMAVADHVALVNLLYRKGIITREEYRAAVIDSMEGMARMYAQPENGEHA